MSCIFADVVVRLVELLFIRPIWGRIEDSIGMVHFSQSILDFIRVYIDLGLYIRVCIEFCQLLLGFIFGILKIPFELYMAAKISVTIYVKSSCHIKKQLTGKHGRKRKVIMKESKLEDMTIEATTTVHNGNNGDTYVPVHLIGSRQSVRMAINMIEQAVGGENVIHRLVEEESTAGGGMKDTKESENKNKPTDYSISKPTAPQVIAQRTESSLSALSEDVSIALSQPTSQRANVSKVVKDEKKKKKSCSVSAAPEQPSVASKVPACPSSIEMGDAKSDSFISVNLEPSKASKVPSCSPSKTNTIVDTTKQDTAEKTELDKNGVAEESSEQQQQSLHYDLPEKRPDEPWMLKEVPSEIGINISHGMTHETVSLTSKTYTNFTLNENDPLLMFLRLQSHCVKGSVEEFYMWLVKSEDIDSIIALKEAVADDDYVNYTLKGGSGGSGIKGFKRKTFQRAVLEYEHSMPVEDEEQQHDDVEPEPIINGSTSIGEMNDNTAFLPSDLFDDDSPGKPTLVVEKNTCNLRDEIACLPFGLLGDDSQGNNNLNDLPFNLSDLIGGNDGSSTSAARTTLFADAPTEPKIVGHPAMVVSEPDEVSQEQEQQQTSTIMMGVSTLRPIANQFDPSEDLVCPISFDLMINDPVLAADGITYERASIEDWFQTSEAKQRIAQENLKKNPHSEPDQRVAKAGICSPVHGTIMVNLSLVQNISVRNMARAYEEENGKKKEEVAISVISPPPGLGPPPGF